MASEPNYFQREGSEPMSFQFAGTGMGKIQIGFRVESQLPPYLVMAPYYTPVGLQMAALVQHAESAAVNFVAHVEACFADMPYIAAADV